jgi:hypothetical protein
MRKVRTARLLDAEAVRRSAHEHVSGLQVAVVEQVHLTAGSPGAGADGSSVSTEPPAQVETPTTFIVTTIDPALTTIDST